MFREDFTPGKAQERYNDVCREEQILQVGGGCTDVVLMEWNR